MKIHTERILHKTSNFLACVVLFNFSALADPVQFFEIVDVDGNSDSQEEIIVIICCGDMRDLAYIVLVFVSFNSGRLTSLEDTLSLFTGRSVGGELHDTAATEQAKK